jgi:energy-coupling factor transport system ATP-binding protein
LILESVSFHYLPGTTLMTLALDEVDLEVRKGEILAVLGSTGSGKSTLLRVLKGIASPSSGRIVLEGEEVKIPEGLRLLRKRVGLVMQNPEAHLFAETVEKDVAFGPRNLGCSRAESFQRAREAVEALGLDYGELRGRNPLSLSLGEQRRVALAGILAMHPDYLLLDEITSGLDGGGKRVLWGILQRLKEEKRGVVLVTHDLEEVEALAERVAVMGDGRLLKVGSKDDILADFKLLERAGYAPPPLIALQRELLSRGFPVEVRLKPPEVLAEEILRVAGHA